MATEYISEGTILLVDDNPTNLGVLFDLLSDAGFKILIATDGESAIAQISYVKPDILLLDVMMPGIDGFETCRRLKQNIDTQDIPIIFMTALTETVDKVKGFEVGAVDYITKPFEYEEVLVRLRTHLTIQNLRRSLEDRNQLLQQEIRDRIAAEEALKIFVHAVSHDLRNPVTGLLMILQNLLAKEKEVSNLSVSRHVLERMAQSSDRQLSLINSLLESHANEIQGVVLHHELLDLRHVAQCAINDLEALSEKEKATLVNLIPEHIAPIKMDALQVSRVFLNLISNALKHNPPGLTLTIRATLENTSQIICTVEDDGLGMTASQCDRLFELYAQGDRTKRSLGLGLGLYLCRQIIQAHGGEIGVTSTPKIGSKFWFTLPIS
jgi:two-component system, sensor histidine kinase and response regulator